MSHADFILTYDGPALAEGRMDARELAPALMAVSDAFDRVNAIANNDETTVKLVVDSSFRSGSFGIDLGVVQDLPQQLVALFNSREVVGALNLIALLGFAGCAGKGILQVLRRLQGRPVKEVIRLKDGRYEIHVNDDKFEIEQQTLDMLRDYELRRALDRAIREPLDRDGIEMVAIQENRDSEPFIARRSERHWYAAPDPGEEIVSEDETTELLQLISISFKEDNKWRVSDGSSSFYAAVLDEGFQRRIDLGDERFSKNDLLRVRLRRKKFVDSTGSLRTEAEILEVLNHQAGARQLNLPMRNDPDQGGAAE